MRHGGETEVHETEGTFHMLGKPGQARMPPNLLILPHTSSGSVSALDAACVRCGVLLRANQRL